MDTSHWFITPMPAKAGVGSGQKSGVPARSPGWVTASQVRGPTPAFQGALEQEARIEIRAGTHTPALWFQTKAVLELSCSIRSLALGTFFNGWLCDRQIRIDAPMDGWMIETDKYAKCEYGIISKNSWNILRDKLIWVQVTMLKFMPNFFITCIPMNFLQVPHSDGIQLKVDRFLYEYNSIYI